MKYVLLKHDPPSHIKPYRIEPLERYESKPPLNKCFKLFGIYESLEAALAAMKTDAAVLKKQLTRRQISELKELYG